MKLPSEIYYVLFALIMFGVMVVLVPRQAIKILFPRALLAGPIVAFGFVIISKLFSLFKYTGFGPFHLLGIPIWILLAWHPSMLVFLYFLPESRQKVLYWSHILSFCIISVAIDNIFRQLGLIEYGFWGLIPRFFVALVWFYLTARWGNNR